MTRRDGPTPLRRRRVAAALLLAAWLRPAAAAIVLPPRTSAPEPSAQDADAPPARSIVMPDTSADEGSAPAELMQRAQAGDAGAMVALGDYYYRHPGEPQAAALAQRWWQQAAQAGDARGMAALGYLLATRGGGTGNLPLARQWLQRASALGLTRALYLRSLVERRSTGPRAAQQAMALLEQAAREGDVMALNDLGVERELAGDKAAATELYRRAARAGLDVARQNLTRLERREQPSGDAVARLRTLANEGDADALLALAQRYHRGDGVPRDYARAVTLYQRAADAGSSRAREILGLIFSQPNAGGAGVSEAQMEQLAARISIASTWEQARRAPALSRPTRVNDPLADLIKPLNPAAVGK